MDGGASLNVRTLAFQATTYKFNYWVPALMKRNGSILSIICYRCHYKGKGKAKEWWVGQLRDERRHCQNRNLVKKNNNVCSTRDMISYKTCCGETGNWKSGISDRSAEGGKEFSTRSINTRLRKVWWMWKNRSTTNTYLTTNHHRRGEYKSHFFGPGPGLAPAPTHTNTRPTTSTWSESRGNTTAGHYGFRLSARISPTMVIGFI